MRILLSIFLFALIFEANAQISTIFYNKEWNVIEDSSKAHYYSKIYKANDSLQFRIVDHFITGEIQMETMYKTREANVDWTQLYVSGAHLGVKHGNCKWFYRNGQPHELVPYKDGIMDGLAHMWWENGNVMTDAFFKEGVAQDTVTQYYENGHRQRQYFIVDGKLNGFFKEWHENGNPKLSTTMKNDFFVGKYETWHENGQKASESEKHMGMDVKGTLKEWDEKGNPKSN